MLLTIGFDGYAISTELTGDSILKLGNKEVVIQFADNGCDILSAQIKAPEWRECSETERLLLQAELDAFRLVQDVRRDGERIEALYQSYLSEENEAREALERECEAEIARAEANVPRRPAGSPPSPVSDPEGFKQHMAQVMAAANSAGTVGRIRGAYAVRMAALAAQAVTRISPERSAHAIALTSSANDFASLVLSHRSMWNGIEAEAIALRLDTSIRLK
jgi:hypothetical protein